MSTFEKSLRINNIVKFCLTKRTHMKAKESTKKKSDKLEKLNKLERAYAEKQISHSEYEMWKKVYMNEKEFVEEPLPASRKKRRRR